LTPLPLICDCLPGQLGVTYDTVECAIVSNIVRLLVMA
jgi:hypothetical protein